METHYCDHYGVRFCGKCKVGRCSVSGCLQRVNKEYEDKYVECKQHKICDYCNSYVGSCFSCGNCNAGFCGSYGCGVWAKNGFCDKCQNIKCSRPGCEKVVGLNGLCPNCKQYSFSLAGELKNFTFKNEGIPYGALYYKSMHNFNSLKCENKI